MNLPSASLPRIASELERFLKRGRVESVFIAEGNLPPPTLGFMVRFPRLSVTLRGADEVEIEQAGRRVTLLVQRGGVLFVPANAWNRPTWARPVKVLHFLFGPKHIGVSLVEHDGRGAEPGAVIKASLTAGGGAMREILNALALLPGEGSAASVGPLLVQALLHTIGCALGEPPKTRGRKGRNSYEKICLYVQEHFQQELTRDSVAAQFRMNPNHLSRLFRREGLMRFIDYVAWVRMDRAKHLLAHQDFTLDEVATSCGFRDTAYFCRVFKQRTNRTPTGYRLESRLKQRAPEAAGD
ncbi:MAG: helix-turn-helix transcriptional regulator [Opitutaceae bacterium]|nr:helix-turn-helix transcriptional regulator [Opitutaceae bacterium]